MNHVPEPLGIEERILTIRGRKAMLRSAVRC
jgi:hypothetical protein